MLKAFATLEHRRVTLMFLAIFCLAVIGTLAIGLDGNTPALVLAFVAATALLLAFMHPWRRAREFAYGGTKAFEGRRMGDCPSY